MTEATSQQQHADQIPFNFEPSHDMNVGLFSASLPLNQQQIVGCALSPSSPSTQFLMAGSEGTLPFLYNSDPSEPAKSADVNETLTSNPLDITPTSETNPAFTTMYSPESTNTAECLQTPEWPLNQMSFDLTDGVGDFKSLDINQFYNCTPTSGDQTPNNFDFSSYIESREFGG